MSRWRKVDPRMWGDAKFRALSHEAQRLWFYLLTGPETTSLPGVMVIGEAGLSEALGIAFPKAFREAFAEASSRGMVKASWNDRLVWLPNAQKYNRPESPNVVVSWGKVWDEIPECSLKVEIYHSLKAFAEGLGEAFAEGYRRAVAAPDAPPSPNQEQEQEQEPEQEQDKTRPAGAVSGKAKRVRKEPPPPSPREQLITELLQLYSDTYYARHGERPAVDFGARGRSSIKGLLAAVGGDADQAREAVRRYIASDDRFHAEGGWALNLLPSQAQKVLHGRAGGAAAPLEAQYTQAEWDEIIRNVTVPIPGDDHAT